MDSHNPLENKEIVLEEGPQIKTLATEHLEYIIYALIHQPEHVHFAIHNETKEVLVTFKNREFNLSAILNARPSFEQFILNKWQLDAYEKRAYEALHALEGYKEKKEEDPEDLPKLIPTFKNLQKETSSDTRLELAEKFSLRRWTDDRYYEQIQYLLDQFKKVAEI